MTVGFSSWMFTESMEWQGGWGYNSIERDFFKSSCLSRFERGTWILLF